MKLNSFETEELLRQAGNGDAGAIGRLLKRHRGRLRRMVAARLDRRVAARLDPSDVVQDALGDASGGLLGYVRDRPLPFYSWLRRLTLLQLSWTHRLHLGARKRCAARDVSLGTRLLASSAAEPVDRLPDTGTSPSQNAVRDEECQKVRAALDGMESPDRIFLQLRYVERLSLAEIADRLDIGSGAAKMRHVRALTRFRGLFAETREEGAS